MGASRKLQGEIDRVLKKVQEGVDVFDSIWNKVYDTDNANQKEKFEADLKKEIKKLQRYRDQIKTWIQSTEIKDKKVSASYEQALLDARKLIEREMERFKICEKETKTKAFSKEGLGQQPKTDPKEKAKSETRDWLNNVVGELESQIDYFEAEAEGLSVKKGKMRPPRLTHLETSIVRHKAHIMKLELILRLLDNDELSPEQVNDVRDFLEDYVERNQDDFDEFSDVDELYISLPLDKVESLEDLVGIGPPVLVKGVTSVSTAGAVLGLKNSLSTSSAQLSATLASTTQQGTSVQEPAEETASQDSNSDVVPRTPPSKNSAMGSAVPPATTTVGSSTLAGSNVLNVSGSSIPARSLVNGPTTTAILSSPLRVNMDNQAVAAQSPVNLSNLMKEDEKSSFPGHRASPALPEIGIGKGIGRGSVVGSMTIQASSVQLNSGNGALSGGTEISDMGKRNILGADERIGSGGLAQPIISSLNNRMLLQQASKANDGMVSTDSGNVADGAVMGGRVFSPPVVSGVQWRPQNANSFPNQNEMFNPQTSSLSSQVGLGLGVQSPVGFSSVPSSPVQSSMLQQSARHPLVLAGAKNADVGHVKAEDQQQQKKPHDYMISGSATNLGLVKNLMNEDDLKMPYAVDTPVAGSGSLTEVTNVPRDTDLSPGQPLQSNQSSAGLGVIGRRSVSDLGAIGDNLSGSTGNSGGIHDQLYNLQMLDAAFHRLPRPKDSERAKNYIPRHLAKTPPSYPQVQAPIVDNPLFWERLSLESLGTDTLFFAFYYQQNTHQQYLAARELKRQSWRYHRKYNTWFQRHEEPKVTTDEYEQGTYVYFDFHIANDDLQHGWCQRIKTEFTFEYSYLEDELVV